MLGLSSPLSTPQVTMGTERQQELTVEITARLRRVCAHLTDAEFAVFAQEVARITEKYETRATPSSVERESPSHPSRAD